MKQEVTVIPFTYHCHHRNDRKYKYLGGVLGPDDCIYCIPSDADFVLKVDPATQTAYEIGESLDEDSGRRGRVIEGEEFDRVVPVAAGIGRRHPSGPFKPERYRY